MTPSNPDLAAERTAQIVQAAIVVFARKGFYSTRMEDVARQAGVSKGTLYLYFRSKDDIVWAILESFFAQEFEGLRALIDAEGAVADRLVEWGRGVVGAAQEMMGVLSIGYELYALAARQDNVRLYLKQHYAGYIDLLEQIVMQGGERGEYSVSNAREIAITIIALLEGVGLLLLADVESVELVPALERGLRVILGGEDLLQ